MTPEQHRALTAQLKKLVDAQDVEAEQRAALSNRQGWQSLLLSFLRQLLEAMEPAE